MDITELHSKCDLHLVYLGNNTYGQLKCKPMMPAPPTSVPKLPIINKRKYSRKSKATSTASKPIDLSCKTDPTPSSSVNMDGFNQSCFTKDSEAILSTSTLTTGFNQSRPINSNDLLVIDITNEDSDKQSSISPAAIQPSKKPVSSNPTCKDTTEVDQP